MLNSRFAVCSIFLAGLLQSRSAPVQLMLSDEPEVNAWKISPTTVPAPTYAVNNPNWLVVKANVSAYSTTPD
ncbi:MAG: hypothetical protein JST58_07230 [Bacteroidetes bacterium]|nr:hypothetical protein [Bacteroidota bacterium]